MRRTCILLGLLGSALGAQDAPFVEETPNRWIPAWEFKVQRESIQLKNKDVWRTRSLLRLRWTLEGEGPFSAVVGSAHALGTDHNADNLAWFDDSASRGTWLDVAALRWKHLGPSTKATVEAGLVESPLLLSEAAWNPILRVIGAGGQVAWVGDGVFEEASLRAVAGQVRLIAGGRVGIKGAQGVLRLATGPIQWTTFLGGLDLEPRQEDAPGFLRQNPGGTFTSGGGPYGGGSGTGYATLNYRYLFYGAGLGSQGPFPFELKAQRLVHQETKEVGEEFQAWVGSPRRTWWPQAGYVRQRLDPYGALASVNGDQWWFHANADGQRYALALNLSARWRVEASVVDQVKRGTTFVVRRGVITLLKRF
ncbi:MAG TPA: hypothetical protein VJ505_13240 [Holophagaceae bacterium]|nr:hypothetical protein [Holophagaceae bacterium]